MQGHPSIPIHMAPVVHPALPDSELHISPAGQAHEKDEQLVVSSHLSPAFWGSSSAYRHFTTQASVVL